MEEAEVAMETDDIKKEPGKKYFIDTNNLRVPRKGMEVQTFLKDGMSKLFSTVINCAYNVFMFEFLSSKFPIVLFWS